MRILPRSWLAAVSWAALLACAAPRAHAQLPADEAWSSLRTQHFRVTWHGQLDSVARHAAAAAERARAALLVWVAEPPSGLIDIVVADNLDLSNGYATPFPSNRVVIYAKPPVDALELQHTADWVEMVLVHELAHIFHLDVSGTVGTALRRIFGRVPLPWPVFGALGTPGWMVEGLATHVESALTGFGRVEGSYHEMVVRTAVLADRFVGIDELGSTSRNWPGGTRDYIYGSLFLDFLARRHGAQAASAIVRATGGALIPAPVWFGGIGRTAFGSSFRDEYDDWLAELRQRYAVLADSLRAQGITSGERLTHHDGWALYPRFSDDGSMIAYAASDRRSPPRTQVIRTRDGSPLWSRRRNDLTPASWKDGDLVVGDLEYIDRFRIFSDVYRETSSGTQRLTHGRRLQEPDVAANGRMVAVQNDGGSNRLVTGTPASGWRTLLPPEAGVHWSLPRFSPPGDRIAAVEWRQGGDFSITVLDTAGTRLWRLPPAPGISGAPAWAHDGRTLLFWSDRTGIPNIFAVDVTQVPARVRQVTNVVTGAYFPDVSPDGRWIAFARYDHDGFSIERIPFDTLQWRDAPSDLPRTDARAGRIARPVYGSPPDARIRAAAAAAAAADTSILEVGRYPAWTTSRPYAWAPVVHSDGNDNLYLGLSLFGRDLVGRHDWALEASASGTGRTMGSAAYRFNGMSAIAGGLHPSLTVRFNRDWYLETAPESPGAPFIEEREDGVFVDVGFIRPRWRYSTGFGAGAEIVRLSRELGRGANLRLRDPHDDLLGIRGDAWLSRYSSPAVAISRQDGFIVQFAGRRRWERNPQTRVIAGRDVVFDRGYSEFSTWNTAYRSIDLPGFARHVLATRVSGVLRNGPNVSRSSLGGISTTGLVIPGLAPDAAGPSLLLPVRGYERGVRSGTRAWSASLEYRAPIAHTSLPLRPLPLFLDRVSSTLFLDAGDAWCDESTASRLGAAACPVAAPRPPLFAAGAEVTLWLSAWGSDAPVRIGFGAPLSSVGPDDRRRFWVVGGHSF